MARDLTAPIGSGIERIDVWIRAVRRERDGNVVYSVNYRTASTTMTEFVGTPMTLPQALVWLGTKLQLDGKTS